VTTKDDQNRITALLPFLYRCAFYTQLTEKEVNNDKLAKGVIDHSPILGNKITADTLAEPATPNKDTDEDKQYKFK
jgi:hypothetical protein